MSAGAEHDRRGRAVLVTGALGYIGRQVTAAFAAQRDGVETVVALDVRPPRAGDRLDGVVHVTADVRSPALVELLRAHGVDTVVHLAAVVDPSRGTRAEQHAIDVLGTENLLRACVAAGVRKIVVTSSGAAYGYHADNPVPLREHDALRGNVEFAYSDHKRQVEELLARYRAEHPELGQLVLRPGTVLGADVANAITALFDKPIIVGVCGAETPFSLIWDQDVVACIVRGVRDDVTGIANLAGDGAVPLRAIAEQLGKRYLPLPAGLLAGALAVLRALRLTRYGPEQVRFLRYRPVLANDRLEALFPGLPRKTSAEVFALFRAGRERARSGAVDGDGSSAPRSRGPERHS